MTIRYYFGDNVPLRERNVESTRLVSQDKMEYAPEFKGTTYLWITEGDCVCIPTGGRLEVSVD
jgi:hypothetical protein